MEQFQHPPRVRAPEASILEEPHPFDEPLIAIDPIADGYRSVEPVELAKAAAVYMTGVFVVCYALVPMVTAQLGLFDGVLNGIVSNFRAFVMMLALTAAGILVFKPKLRMPQFGNKSDTDPWLAATSGSLFSWALIHNVHPWLLHFVDLSGVELATFVAMNVLESALFGMLLASLVATRREAFILGASFNAVFLTGALWFI